jgi:hypothetical protein
MASELEEDEIASIIAEEESDDKVQAKVSEAENKCNSDDPVEDEFLSV